MRVVKSISEVKEIISEQRKNGKTIGLVPTMGYLHEGHLSLVKASRKDTDFTMSIFVNPTQFGANEDLDKYPRDMDRDKYLAEKEDVDLIFAPSVEEMYPNGYKTYVEVNDITEVLCGRSRPGHFKGVTTIVNKLFNIVTPDFAYFGQKDAQQVIVIKKMVQDLNMDVRIVICPIVREMDGLAMSSRNVYLNKEERMSALILSFALREAEKLILKGEKDKDIIQKFITAKISQEKLAKIDYVEIVDASTLEDVKNLEGEILIAIAVKFGNTRLIDNILINTK